jgi:Zn-finger nucleic acid-binding protein
MRCPICKTVALAEARLDPELPSHACGKCGGAWIGGQQYTQWLTRQTSTDSATSARGISTPGHDSLAAKLCPECGRFLVRYHVGHGIEFCIDRCTTCGGIWLDADEWQALRAQKLHDVLHLVFSAAWQAEIHRRNETQRHDQMLKQKLGAADVAEIHRVKQWLDSHPHRTELYAYLMHGSEPPPTL